MYCRFCGAYLAEEAHFCLQCGELISRENAETGSSEHTAPTFVSVSSPSDPYSPPPSTYYEALSPEGKTQNPYVPPKPYVSQAPAPPSFPHRTSPGFLKGFFSGLLIIFLLGAGFGGWLFLRSGAFSPKVAPHPTAPGTRPTAPATTSTQATSTAQANATAQPAGILYTADWSSGLNGWSELPGFQDWKVSGGMLRDDGTNSGWAAPGIKAPYEVTGTSDYAVETEIQAVAGSGCFDITTIRANANWLGYKAVACQSIVMIKKISSNDSPKGSTIADIVFDPKTDWHTYRLEAKGTIIRLLIDGNQVLQVNDNTYSSGSELGMNSYKTPLNVRSYKVFAI